VINTVKKKWIYILAASVAVVIVAVLITLQQLNKPDKIIEALDEAVEKENPELLSELLVPDDKDVEVSSASVKSLIDYLKKNNNSYQVIKDGLYDQIEKDDFSATSQQISLIQDGKKWGFYPDYKLYVNSGFIKVSGQNDGDEVELKIEGLKDPIKKDDDGVYGPILPGNHNILLTINNELGTITDERQTDVWGSDQVSLIVDTNKMVKEDENIQRDIMEALDTFNNDMSKFTTSEFDLSTFTNVSGTLDSDQILLTNEFDLVKDYIDEIHSQYEGAIVNLDEFDISYFNGEWSAEISALVSYNEKIKFTDTDKFEDVSFESVRNYALYYDEDENKWLIYDFVDMQATGSEDKDWDNTQDMMIDDPPVLKWDRDGKGTSI